MRFAPPPDGRVAGMVLARPPPAPVPAPPLGRFPPAPPLGRLAVPAPPPPGRLDIPAPPPGRLAVPAPPPPGRLPAPPAGGWRALPPKRFAVFRSPYGALPRGFGLCCHFPTFLLMFVF